MFIILILVSCNLYTQNVESIKINPEITKIFFEKKVNKDWNPKLYETIEVDSILLYKFERGETISDLYSKQLEIVENNKMYFVEYERNFEYASNKKNELDSIIFKINDYLKSNSNYQLKKQLLIDSQEIANKYGIKIITYKRNNSLFDKLIDNNANSYSNSKKQTEIFIYENNKKPKEEDLKICIEFILNEKNKINFPVKNDGYKKYLNELEILNKTPKTIITNVKSEKSSYRSTILISEKHVDFEHFEAELSPIKGDYYIAKHDFESPKYSVSIIKDEILSYDQIKHINGFDMDYLRLCYPVNLYEDRKNNGKVYVLNRSDWSFYGDLKKIKKEIDFRDLLVNLGYKIYEKESYTNLNQKYYKSFIKTKNAEIELKEDDNYLYEMLKEDKKYLEKFDLDYLKLKTLINKIPPHSKVLSNYLNIYNLKRSFTPTSTINEWKNATRAAKPIADDLIEFRSKYALIYDFKELKTDIVTDFIGYCAYSSKILGLL
ncbi:hypothetical protein [uncultured Flavobacterium sp.]|uniref:hypothetical protein n=1 Tax=uncultured Flavobacterium sp. TaxID=165435 RepID=UPI00260EC0E1|nr:hypothetical protein [uncultured Flavobacterium sp.]